MGKLIFLDGKIVLSATHNRMQPNRGKLYVQWRCKYYGQPRTEEERAEIIKDGDMDRSKIEKRRLEYVERNKSDVLATTNKNEHQIREKKVNSTKSQEVKVGSNKDQSSESESPKKESWEVQQISMKELRALYKEKTGKGISPRFLNDRERLEKKLAE